MSIGQEYGFIMAAESPLSMAIDVYKRQGPDFPTGAMIMGKASMREAYRTGQGKVVVRAVAEIEEASHGKQQIIVTEIPYQVNKATVSYTHLDVYKRQEYFLPKTAAV